MSAEPHVHKNPMALQLMVICYIVVVLIGCSPEMSETTRPASKTKSTFSGEGEQYINRFLNKKFWYGLYIEGKKFGYMNYGFYSKQKDQKNVIVLETNTTANTAIEGQESTSKSVEKIIFDKESGELLGCSVESNESVGNKNDGHTAVKNNGVWVITDQAGKKRETPVSVENYNFKGFFADDIWVSSRPQIGDKMKGHAFECETMEYFEYTSEIIAIEPTLISGSRVKVYDILLNLKETAITLKILEDSRLWSTQLGEMEFRLESENIAKNNLLSMDVFKPIQIKNPIDDYERLNFVKLKISKDQPLSDIQESFQQGVVKNDENTFTVSLGSKTAIRQKLQQSDYEKYVAASFEYPADQLEISNLARKITGNAKTEDEKIWSILTFTSNTLIDDYWSNSQNVLEILRSQKGDCSEHAKLFVTLARAAGLPAREASGLVYNNDEEKPGFSGHAWAEVGVDGHWVGVDPMWGERVITPIRIKFNDLASTVSKLKIEILETQYNFKASDEEIERGRELNDKKDYETEITHWRALSEKGDAFAQFKLGYKYYSGAQGVPKDYKAALKWTHRAAEQGHALAQHNLGIFHANGEGVEASLRDSIFWFNKAANNGDLQSAYYLAEAYEKGESVPKNREMAFDLYKEVALEALLSE
ncbi:MAG: hypothetical protein HOB18_06875 [Nitrospina sp.]|jgi:hypothetical protein|nr:hypothetical protein [Nitrospina sp.]